MVAAVRCETDTSPQAHNPAMLRPALPALGLVLGATLLALAACSPGLNWRQTRSDNSALRALLPCKPDKATREVEMGGLKLQMDMQGCDAAGATFAVSHVHVDDGALAAPLLEGWRAAVLAHVHAAPPGTAPFVPPGAMAGPQAVRLQTKGKRADGTTIAVDAAWFGSVGPKGFDLFHAAMFSERPMPEAAETFFTGLSLQ